jgi:hypothetical protein
VAAMKKYSQNPALAAVPETRSIHNKAIKKLVKKKAPKAGRRQSLLARSTSSAY